MVAFLGTPGIVIIVYKIHEQKPLAKISLNLHKRKSFVHVKSRHSLIIKCMEITSLRNIHCDFPVSKTASLPSEACNFSQYFDSSRIVFIVENPVENKCCLSMANIIASLSRAGTTISPDGEDNNTTYFQLSNLKKCSQFIW